jgi:hypothetical protein
METIDLQHRCEQASCGGLGEELQGTEGPVWEREISCVS